MWIQYITALRRIKKKEDRCNLTNRYPGRKRLGYLICITRHDLYEYTFFSAPIEYPILDLFPRTEIKLPIRDRNDNFTPHDLTLHVCIDIVFASVIVAALAD